MLFDIKRSNKDLTDILQTEGNHSQMEIMIYKKKHRKKLQNTGANLNNHFLYKIIAIYPGFKIKYREENS